MALVRWLRGVRPVYWDTLFAVALVAIVWVSGHNHNPITGRDFSGPAYLLSALILLPFAARRRFTMTALVVSATTHIVYTAAGYHMDLVWWGPVIGLFYVVAYRPRWMAAIGSVVTFLGLIQSGMAHPLVTPPVLVAQSFVIIAAVWVVGNGARAHAERGRRLAQLTGQLRREQADRERRAVAEEQVRIARELHDVVAHHMSVISVQVGLAQYVFGSDPPTARAALDEIATAGREAQQEMRQLLQVLRPHGGVTEALDAPAPRLAGLDGLADSVRAAGLPVDVVIDGTVDRLPVHLDLCAYRVVQEALTNVLKHAGPARAVVTVRHGSGGLTVSVVDDGRGDAAIPGAGHGLIGMRERARLCGGVLDAGPRPAGGYAVTLTLPA